MDDASNIQRTVDGKLRHLLTLDGLSRSAITELLDRAASWQYRERKDGGKSRPDKSDKLAGRTVANLFFEASTRTRASFELAARRLGADVLNLDIQRSSHQKGETIVDTVITLEAMGVDTFVIRTSSAGASLAVARSVGAGVNVLNAGEGNLSHPTQGLLDLLTIRNHKRDFEGLRAVIVGDIKHSRVARSAATGLATMGVTDIRLCAPPSLRPADGSVPGEVVDGSLDDALNGADIVMALRIQKERFVDDDQLPDLKAYHEQYGITSRRLEIANRDALVMHPGPMNRGVEIDDAVADGPQSVIREQVASGVAVRMAVLQSVAALDVSA